MMQHSPSSKGPIKEHELEKMVNVFGSYARAIYNRSTLEMKKMLLQQVNKFWTITNGDQELTLSQFTLLYFDLKNEQWRTKVNSLQMRRVTSDEATTEAEESSWHFSKAKKQIEDANQKEKLHKK